MRVLILLCLLTSACATASLPRRVQVITDPVTGRVYRCAINDPCDAPLGLRPPETP